ncbi:hypothetical protein ARMSODRAFT_1068784 [Armillaria solidipes]|uniref:Uncharacterized protein n=1 Tax=Armillaria solidipes TaxID=1076256 RepID=A0A2H3AZG7_9AGAR|nr:hypothetical protein ARMSODRAFT_1068784 [Armillaria solidipes]
MVLFVWHVATVTRPTPAKKAATVMNVISIVLSTRISFNIMDSVVDASTSSRIANVQVYIQPHTGIKYFICTTPGCSFKCRKLHVVCNHRETCYEVQSDNRLEEIPAQVKETMRSDLALGRRIFPFLYDEPAGSKSLSLIDWDASLDNPLVPDWWKEYLALVPVPEHLGSASRSEQLPPDTSMDTSSEGMEEKPLSLSNADHSTVPLDVDVKGTAGSSANDRVNAASSSSKGFSFSFASFDLEQSQPLTPGSILAEIEDIEMKLEAIFVS